MSGPTNTIDGDLAGFLEKIKSPSGEIRLAAWRSASSFGEEAIAPLAELAADSNKGISKAAIEAIRCIAHNAARPGSTAGPAVSRELVKIASSNKPRMVRADVLELVGIIGDGRSVPALVNLMSVAEIREDARMALERIPGMASLEALRKALAQAQATNSDFAPNLSQSMHNRRLNPQTVGIAPEKKK